LYVCIKNKSETSKIKHYILFFFSFHINHDVSVIATQKFVITQFVCHSHFIYFESNTVVDSYKKKHIMSSQMDSSSLYNRIYQRVASEVNNDDEFCVYLAEICSDSNSHCDDLRDIIDTMFKTNHSNISETRRQHIIYALLDIVETSREQTTQTDEQEVEDEIEFNEKIERDGECKLCGCEQRITSRNRKKTATMNFHFVNI